MNAVLTTKLPLSTELLVSAFLEQVDNMTDDRYQQKVAKRLAKDTVSFLLFANFDTENPLNKQLISMCVKKRVFPSESKKAVLIEILIYAKKLHDFAVESLDTYDANERMLDDFFNQLLLNNRYGPTGRTPKAGSTPSTNKGATGT